MQNLKQTESTGETVDPTNQFVNTSKKKLSLN